MKSRGRIAGTPAIVPGADVAGAGGTVAVRRIEIREVELDPELRLIEIRIEIKPRDRRKKKVVSGGREEVVTDLRAKAIASRATERGHLKRVSPLTLVKQPLHPLRETARKPINSELIRYAESGL